MHKNNTYRYSLLLVGLLTTIIITNFPIHTSMAQTQNNTSATFAGGCFWCSEYSFEVTPGVTEAISGYAGGTVENPTYAQVCSGTTGHYEAVMVYYDSEIITYKELLDVYWKHIDPTDPGGQFADRGTQYRTAIFYHNQEQKTIAEESKKDLNDSGKFDNPIVTQILPFTTFYHAEEYHQNFYQKQQARFNQYESLSGREQFIQQTWGSSEYPSHYGIEFPSTPTVSDSNSPTKPITPTPTPAPPTPNQTTPMALSTSLQNIAGNMQPDAFYSLAGAAAATVFIVALVLLFFRRQKIQTKFSSVPNYAD